MSMNAAELGLRRTGDPRDAAYADMIAGIRTARGSDIPLPLSVPSTPTEHTGQFLTRESITTIFSTMWTARNILLKNAGIDADFTFEPCAYTQKELNELEADGRGVGYIPPEVASQENRHLLGIMFPQMQSHSVQVGNTVTNEVDRSGWFDYEVAIDAPHLDTTEDALRRAIEEEGGQGMNLNEYIIASQDSKVLTGKYLDETSTWSRLLGSRYGGDVVGARFRGGGRLNVGSDLDPQAPYGNGGGRFVGVPKVA